MMEVNMENVGKVYADVEMDSVEQVTIDLGESVVGKEITHDSMRRQVLLRIESIMIRILFPRLIPKYVWQKIKFRVIESRFILKIILLLRITNLGDKNLIPLMIALKGFRRLLIATRCIFL